MLILQAILSLLFLIFAEKSKTHSDAFENASDPSKESQSFQEFGRESRQCSQIVDENYPLSIHYFFKNQFVQHNLDKFWNYYFFKYFLDVTCTLSLGKNIRSFNCFELRKTEFIRSKFCLQCYLFVTFTSTYILKYSVYIF